MKEVLVFLAAMFWAGSNYFAQDTIRFTDGSTQSGRVQEVSSILIKYKKADNPNGPLFSVPVKQVYMIIYENGSRDFFNNTTSPVATRQQTAIAPTTTIIAPVRYSGPRVGCTLIGEGVIANTLTTNGAAVFVSQFGWQFEWRIFSSQSGIQGLVEFVPLIAGLERGIFLPSGSLLYGMRGKGGYEFAIGPNISLSGLGMVFAVGTSFHVDDVYFPINLAFVPSVTRAYTTVSYIGTKTSVNEQTGHRISLLIGFNTRKK
jgi:hypothetical protein